MWPQNVAALTAGVFVYKCIFMVNTTVQLKSFNFNFKTNQIKYNRQNRLRKRKNKSKSGNSLDLRIIKTFAAK